MTSRWRDAGVGLGVLAGLGALAAVPAVVSAALPAQGPPLNRPVEVGYGVRVDPPPGARLDVTDSRPGTGEVVLVTGEGLRIRLSAVAYQGDPEPFTAHARHRLARDELLRPAGRPEPLRALVGELAHDAVRRALQLHVAGGRDQVDTLHPAQQHRHLLLDLLGGTVHGAPTFRTQLALARA